MYDKLSIINTCLKRTGNNVVNFEGDGSDEWIVGDDAYETEVPNLLAEHDWGFATEIVSLTRVEDSVDPRFSDAFQKPIGCLHVEAVYINGLSVVYDIVGNFIVLNASGSLPYGKSVIRPTNDQWPPLFIETLRQRIMSHIYRGLNEDTVEADKLYTASEATLNRARTRSDQETPPRKLVVSPLRLARMRRRGGYGAGQYRNGLYVPVSE